MWSLCLSVASAQPASDIGPSLEPYAGRLVQSIRIEGLSRVSEQYVRNQLRVSAGRPFDPEVVSGDVRRLHALAEFSRVEASVELLPEGAVEVVYTVDEAPIIQDIQVVGNRQLNDQEIAEEVNRVNLVTGVPVDSFRLDRARRAIEELYRRNGYFNANVTVDQEELAESGIVLFRVREGERLRITAIRFEGARSLPLGRLRAQITTDTAGLFDRGVLDEAILDQDIASLQRFYQTEGFLDVRVDRQVTISPNGREAIVTFLVDEGPRYILRNVLVEGLEQDPDGRPEALLFSAEQVKGLIEIKPGAVYGVDDGAAAARTLERAYHRLGWIDANVDAEQLRVPEESRVDLLLIVRMEGKRYRTGEVIVQGNTITKQSVVRRQVEVRPDRPLDRTAVEETQSRLASLRLFDPQDQPTATIQPERPEDPDYRDLLIEVTEFNTGQINFQVAASNDSGLIGSIQLVERNFDITNFPDSFADILGRRAFRGGGQRLELFAAPGTEIQSFGGSLTEPALAESDISLSVGGSFRDRIFDEYDEERLRATFALGRRFGDRWESSLQFRADNVELTDFDDDTPVETVDSAGPDTIFGVQASLIRTTVPFTERFRPTRGARTELSVEQVFGDFNFTKLNGEHTVFLTVAEDPLGRRSVLSLNLRAAYIPQTDEPPVYETFFLGGSSFRGFDFRGVSPRGTRRDGAPSDDPIGGAWLFFAGAQFEQPLYRDIFSVVTFLDTGTVEEDVGFSDYRVSVGFGLRIRVPQLGPVPLAFDFAFPIVDEPDDDRRLFTFTADIPF